MLGLLWSIMFVCSPPSWGQLPHYALQSRINSCGAAALAAVLQSLGHGSIDEHALWQWAQQDYRQMPLGTPHGGLSLADLKRLSHRAGISTKGVRVPATALRSLPTPAIIRLLREPLPHFVVLWQVQGQMAQVFDPAVGNHWLALSSLLARNQSANNDKGTNDKLSALIVDSPPPT